MNAPVAVVTAIAVAAAAAVAAAHVLARSAVGAAIVDLGLLALHGSAGTLPRVRLVLSLARPLALLFLYDGSSSTMDPQHVTKSTVP
jgi:hypothetical protein